MQQLVLLGNPNEFKKILNFIKKIRESNKLSQREMANLLNINYSKYARIEKGIQPLTLDFLCHFLNQFNFKLQILEENNEKTEKIEKNKVVSNFDNNMQNQYEIILNQLSILNSQLAIKDEQIKQLINIIAAFK